MKIQDQLANFLPDHLAVARAMASDHRTFVRAFIDALDNDEKWSYDLMYWLRRVLTDNRLHFNGDSDYKIRRFDYIQECLTLGFERMAQEAIGDWLVEHERWMTVEEKEGEVV